MKARFKIEAAGLSAVDDAAKRELSARSGSYDSLATGSDLFCLVRTQPLGESPPKQRVVLVGDAGGFPVSDLMGFLAQARWSGTVRMVGSTGDRSILVKEGNVRGALSDDPNERLTELMVRFGFVTREQVEEALQSVPPSRVGRAMVEQGVLPAHELFKCLTLQIEEIFHSMVLTSQGAFSLAEADQEEKATHSLSVSIQNLLMDSVRKIDEMARFRKKIPHGRLCVSKKKGSDGTLEKEEDGVLALVNGERSVLELAKAARLTEFDATRIVFRLLEGGYVQVLERPPSMGARGTAQQAPAGAARATKDASGIASVFNLIYGEIREAVTRSGQVDTFAASANAALAGRALSASPVIEGLSFDQHGELPMEPLLARYEQVKGKLGSEPLASFRQALSDVMFFLLFQAGELLGAEADEELARKVKLYLAALDAE